MQASLQYGEYPMRGPLIPTDVCGDPTELAVTLNGDIVTFRWKKPHDVLYYKLVITQGANPPMGTILVSGQAYTIQLSPNLPYTWTVTSVCSLSLEGSAVAGPGFSTGDHVVACIPTNIGSVTALPTIEGMLLSWPVNNDAVAYKVFYKPTGAILEPYVAVGQLPLALLKNLIPKKEYTYTIVTVGADGIECTSEEGTFTTSVDPSECPPPNPRVLVRGTTAVAVWETNGIYLFDIYLNSSLVVINYPGNLFTFKNLSPVTTYTVSVIAKCNEGNSIAGEETFLTGSPACPKMGAITLSGIVSGVATIVWPAATGAVGYLLVINGTAVLLGNILTHNFNVLPGQNINIAGYTRCANDVYATEPSLLVFEVPFSCPPLTLGAIEVTEDSTSVFIDWSDLSGADYYEYRYKKTTDGSLLFTDWIKTTNSQILITLLEDTTSYNLEIKTVCVDGTTATFTTIFTTTALKPGLKPVITGFDNITSSQGCVSFTIPDGKLVGDFRIEVTDVLLATIVQTISHNRTYKCITGLSPTKEYSVRVSEIRDGYTQVWSDPATFTTCFTLTPPAITSALLNEDGETEVEWDAMTNLDAIEVYYRLLGEVSTGVPLPWIKFGADLAGSATDVTITDHLFVYKEVKIVAVYDDDCGSAEAIQSVACPKVTELVASVENDNALLQWKAVPGVFQYRINLVTLQEGLEQYYSKTNSILVEHLLPRTTYSWSVTAICTEDINSAGPESDALTFNTGDATESDNGCEPPLFTAYVEDSSLSNPEIPGIDVVDNTDPAGVNYVTHFNDSFDRNMFFKDADSVPIDITGYTFVFNIVPLEETVPVLLAFSSAEGSIENYGVTGEIRIYKNASAMSVLPEGIYNYYLRWTTPEAVVRTIMAGTFTVYPEGAIH